MSPTTRHRVLHAVQRFGAASETFILDRMIELDRLGWEAWLAAESLVQPPDPDSEFPPRDRRVVARRRHRLGSWLRRGARTSPSWWIEPGIRAAHPEIVHAHFGWNGLAALPATLRHDIPLVVGLHGYDVTVYPTHGLPAQRSPGAAAPEGDGVYGELLDRAHVIVVSRYLEGRLRDLGYRQAVDVIPSGIRLEQFPYRGPRSNPTACRLLFIGRLIPYKGLEVALRALAALPPAVADPQLDVIGDGEERGNGERLADQLGVADRTRFHGSCPRSVVLRALQACDILVVPSRTTANGQAEALGNVSKEAYAVGLQVAATNSGGIPEVTPPERRDELVSEGDELALAGRIERLWLGRDQWPARAEAARGWVEQTFDWRLLAPRIAAVYESCLSQRSTATR